MQISSKFAIFLYKYYFFVFYANILYYYKYVEKSLWRDDITKRIYFISCNKNKNESEKPFLFCTFHPSEYGYDEYITPILLKKDVS